MLKDTALRGSDGSLIVTDTASEEAEVLPEGSVTFAEMNHWPGVSIGNLQLRTPGAPTKTHVTVLGSPPVAAGLVAGVVATMVVGVVVGAVVGAAVGLAGGMFVAMPVTVSPGVTPSTTTSGVGLLVAPELLTGKVGVAGLEGGRVSMTRARLDPAGD
ncbi:MAG: hypothetical protein ACKOYL_11195, partial [Actinomycetota bacterium]